MRLLSHYSRLCLPHGAREHLKFPRNQQAWVFRLQREPQREGVSSVGNGSRDIPLDRVVPLPPVAVPESTQGTAASRLHSLGKAAQEAICVKNGIMFFH